MGSILHQTRWMQDSSEELGATTAPPLLSQIDVKPGLEVRFLWVTSEDKWAQLQRG
jgi:hypothetical protein